MGFRALRFLLDAQHLPRGVELHHPLPFRVPDPVAEDRRARLGPGRPPQDLLEVVAMEYVVPKDQAGAVVRDEFLPVEERLGESFRMRLSRVGNPDAPMGAVPEQILEP
jgi:hypothetical protein